MCKNCSDADSVPQLYSADDAFAQFMTTLLYSVCARVFVCLCVCSLSDRREALSDPGLPPRRRPFHPSIKGGRSAPDGLSDSVPTAPLKAL